MFVTASIPLKVLLRNSYSYSYKGYTATVYPFSFSNHFIRRFVMVVCAYIALSWIILLACFQLFVEFQKIEGSVLNVLQAICLFVLSVLGIIGISLQ